MFKKLPEKKKQKGKIYSKKNKFRNNNKRTEKTLIIYYK